MPSTLMELYSDFRIRRFWALGLIATTIHTILDPLSTYVIVNVLGVGAEANLWLASYLNQGAWPFIAIHVPLYLFVFILLLAFTALFRRATDAEATQLYGLSLIIWGGIILWGLSIIGSNVLVLFGGF